MRNMKFDKFGARLDEPPIVGFPDKPEDPGEPPPRSGQCCANCNAFGHDVMGNTICEAHPATPIFLGMGTTKTLNAQGQSQPVPIVWGFWPPTQPERWCREWEWIGPGNGDG